MTDHEQATYRSNMASALIQYLRDAEQARQNLILYYTNPKSANRTVRGSMEAASDGFGEAMDHLRHAIEDLGFDPDPVKTDGGEDDD